jgi:hypothetical protein|tara:strand:+ start:1425 stop:1562 length:138 start_codon:yes stop_codon:yes gene_type:complete
MKDYAGGSHGKGNRPVQSGSGNAPVATASGNRFPAGTGPVPLKGK